MTISSFQKEQGEGGLRLVPDSRGSVSSGRRSRSNSSISCSCGSIPSGESSTVVPSGPTNRNSSGYLTSFRDDFLLFSYSLVGFDSKADLMFWRVGRRSISIQEMTAKLYRTELGSYLETADNYLSITKR